MWLLECDGDLFDHKKIWLRPGNSLILGRTKTQGSPSERRFEIDAKSVSRQHLVISVSKVKAGDSVFNALDTFWPDEALIQEQSRTHVKSELKLTDDSKFGTILDGTRFKKDTKQLSKSEHTFQLGNDARQFKITWRPVVLSMSFTEKQLRSQADLLQPYRDKVEQLDVKVIQPFEFDATTHVVAAKRNIPKVLLGLINARHIVTESFVTAIVEVSASPGFADDGETPLRSPLEDDYEACWPEAEPFLPPAGKEPNPRPADYFKPDSSRSSVFDGFTFVFADKAQHENLAEPVASGGAKCPLFDLKLGETRVAELVDYVRQLSGNKGFDPGSAKGPVVVRFRSKYPETADWAIDFIQELDLELGQRSVEQNEFLDAILTKDASGLKRALEEDDADTAPATARHTRETSSAGAAAAASPNPSRQPSVSSWRQRRAESKFTGFDDFDDDKFEAQLAAVPENEQVEEAESQGLFVTEDDVQTRGGPTSNRKRGQEVFDVDAEIDKFLPGTRAMKRRKLEENAGAAPVAPDEEQQKENDTAAHVKKNKAVKEVERGDLRNTARTHAEAMDRKKRGQQAELVAADETEEYADEDITNLRNLAIVEEMEVPSQRKKDSRARQSGRQADGGWNEEWNGRKNFKRFRRKGEPAANRGQRVIVRLEEEKRKDYGVGDDYWLDSPRRSHDARSQSRSQRDSGGGRRETAVETDEAAVTPGDDSAAGRTESMQEGRTRASKRPASSGAEARPAKKSRPTRSSQRRAVTAARGDDGGSSDSSNSSSSDDDDGLRFRLRR